MELLAARLSLALPADRPRGTIGRARLCRAATLLLGHALQPHVLTVESEAARIRHMGCFHREDNVIASACDRANPGIAQAVLEFELEGVAGNLRGSLTFWRSAMGIGKGGVERYLHRAAGLFDA